MTLRLFVALDLPGEVRDELVRWQTVALGAQAGLRAVTRDALHVTLCFLGAQPPEAVGEVLAALAGLAEADTGDSLTLTLGPGVWLPRRAPRVLAVGLDDSGGELAARQGSLARDLAARGLYRPEARPFLAHVTVARVRRGARVAADPLPPPAPLAFAARTVTLFRSRPEAGGARYEPLGSVVLGRE